MDHEVQQARNVGLEALRAGGFAGRGLGVGGQVENLTVGYQAVVAWKASVKPDIVAMAPGFKILLRASPKRG